MKKTAARLDLSAGQRRQVDAILDQTRHEAEALRRRVVPQAEAIMEGTNLRLAEILTPEQRKQLEVIQRRHHQRLERFLER